MTHTPGPWVACFYPTAVSVYSVRPNSRRITGLTCWEDVPYRSTAEANARLIAAAPELLEALQAICGEGDHTAMTMRKRRVFDAGKAVIAKATGQ